MARFLILWALWMLFFMAMNLPIYTVYGLKFGVYFAICANFAAFAALFIEMSLYIGNLLKKGK